MCLNYAWVWRWVSIFTRLSQHTHTRYLSLVMTILTEELPIAFTFSQARVAHGTPITNDAPYVSCHEVKSTHLHGRTPLRGAQCPLTWEFRFDWMGVAPLILHSNNCSRLYFIATALRSFRQIHFLLCRYFIYFKDYVFLFFKYMGIMNRIDIDNSVLQYFPYNANADGDWDCTVGTLQNHTFLCLDQCAFDFTDI